MERDSQESHGDVNPSIICPILLRPMVDPVIDREGNSFERVAIYEWIALHGTSPITRNPCSTDDLIPNRTLKDLINHLNSLSDDDLGTENLGLQVKLDK